MKLFIFGSTGDLIRRKVLPALQKLNLNMQIYAVGRREFTDEIYRKFICKKNCTQKFKKTLNYIKTDFNRSMESDITPFLDKNKVNYFYIALPHKIQKKIILLASLLKKRSYKIKLIMEKPIGSSNKHFIKLNKKINSLKLSKEFFISDHYLFKESILNLKKQKFKTIKIISLEKLGLEGRAGYYEGVGALIDMVQSHFLNILFKLTIDAKSLKRLSVKKYIRGQYGDGKSEGYAADLGKSSGTETFVYLVLSGKNKEITFITGKSMDKKEFTVELDGKSYTDSGENAYEKLFSNFFKGDKTKFPSLKNTALAWNLIEKINKNKPSLIYYKKGASLNKIFNEMI